MSHMKKEEYLRILAEQIRCRQARVQVTREIRSHIEEQEEVYLSEGLTREEAEAEAVKEMGDPVESGAALDLVHRPRMAWGFIGMIAVLYMAGYIILNLLQSNFSEEYFIAGDHLKWLLIGLGVMVGVCYADYSRIGRWAREITAAAFVLLFGGMYLFGQQVNGSLRWMNIPILSVSVNMQLLCFLFVPLYAAIVYHYRGQRYLALGKCFLWMLPGLCIAIKIPSVMTVLMLFFTYLVIISFAVIEGWFRVSKAKALGAVWGGMAMLSYIVYLKIFLYGPEYQLMRLRVLLHMEEGQEPYQTRILNGILKGCRWIGGGEGESAARAAEGLGMDYSLVYIIACYGILAAIFAVGMLVCLFVYFMGMSVGQKNRLGSIMGVGCTAVLFVQVIYYVLVNTGILPSGAAYCPFLTYGGTGVLVTNILMGILLSIYRFQDVSLEEERGDLRQFLSVRRTVL